MNDLNGGCSPVRLFGLSFRNTRLVPAARQLVADALAGERQRVFFVNAHCINVAASDAPYRAALESADALHADGVGMRMAGRSCGVKFSDNVNGSDLFPHLCEAAAEAGVSLALLGATHGVAEQCAARLERDYPGLKVAFFHHGYFDGDKTGTIIDAINDSGAGILLVALGVPKQELWIQRHASELQVPVAIGVGGLLDFCSGTVPRAPQFVRAISLEWLFRLAIEPRRLFRRYVLGIPRFLLRVAGLKFRAEPSLTSSDCAPRRRGSRVG